jgi:hypothetical protein
VEAHQRESEKLPASPANSNKNNINQLDIFVSRLVEIPRQLCFVTGRFQEKPGATRCGLPVARLFADRAPPCLIPFLEIPDSVTHILVKPMIISQGEFPQCGWTN